MSKTVDNKIIFTDSKNIEAIKAQLKSNNKIYLAEIDGKQIQSWEDYILAIQTSFKLPTPCFDNIDRYLDLMKDLGWLDDKEGYILIITNYSMFFKNNEVLKELFIKSFVDVILPFWQEEVEKVVVEGKAKPFTVYLVD